MRKSRGGESSSSRDHDKISYTAFSKRAERKVSGPYIGGFEEAESKRSIIQS